MSIIAIGIMQMEPKVKQNHIRGLVLTPTHKLTVQVTEAIAVYGKYEPGSSQCRELSLGKPQLNMAWVTNLLAPVIFQRATANCTFLFRIDSTLHTQSFGQENRMKYICCQTHSCHRLLSAFAGEMTRQQLKEGFGFKDDEHFR